MGVREGGRAYYGLGEKGGGKSLIATYPEYFVLISQLEVCGEGEGHEGGLG